ncbi:MAG TPA: type II secretion system protein GspM [Candidatus Competibacter sp.]|nr:general secretion pathway protein [Candidatus Competibacteraceae bacterium]HRC73900.1 type II secretion system protein GspM [Candidatus Competibacter sp.]
MAAPTKPGLGHRLSALLLLVLVIGGFYLLVDRILVGRYHFYHDRLEQTQGRLAQLERMAASREPIQRLIANIQQDSALSAQYLPQSAPPLAAADLQQRVKTVIEASGATLRSTQTLPPVEEGNAVKVSISTSLVGDTESLQKILYNLEAQTPLLFVDNVDVSARDNRPRLPNGRLASYTRVQLTVQFEVSGYLRKESG